MIEFAASLLKIVCQIQIKKWFVMNFYLDPMGIIITMSLMGIEQP